MLGLNDQSWRFERSNSATKLGEIKQPSGSDHAYTAYFGMGHRIHLIDRNRVFKVSLAGLALGAYLVKALSSKDLSGRFLDLGTGSGVQAILLRSLGASDVVATDISPDSVTLAQENERLNFGENRINYVVSNLFDELNDERDRFETIVFNPPGWRTPSRQLMVQLESLEGPGLLSMFYGERVLLEFLKRLPNYLKKDGRAIVGMNSLVGIQDVLHTYQRLHACAPRVQFRLIERHTFPLLFYSEQWRRASASLLQEFSVWKDRHTAAYSQDGSGRLYWSYELVECRSADTESA